MSQTKPRTWSVRLQFDEDGIPLWDVFREDARQAHLEAEAIGDKLGGAFMIVPERMEVAPGDWRTVAWHFRWTSFVPGPAPVKDEQPAPEDQDEPEIAPEPEAAAVAA